MIDMFKNYDNIPAGYVPDNRIRMWQKDCTDEIVIGGTCEHLFVVNFSITEMCKAERPFEITYKQSIGVVETLTYPIPVGQDRYFINITEPNGVEKTIVRVQLNPEFTKLFDKDKVTSAQMKLFLADGTIIFGDINPIKVIDVLENIK